MSAITDDAVVRLRTGFVKRAVLQVRELAAHGEFGEALTAVGELSRYFECVKEDISLEERGPLFEQIQALLRKFKGRRDLR